MYYFNFDSEGGLTEIRMPESIAPSVRAFCAFMAAQEYWGAGEPGEDLPSVRAAWDRLRAIVTQVEVLEAEGLIACQLVYYATCGKWHYAPNERKFYVK